MKQEIKQFQITSLKETKNLPERVKITDGIEKSKIFIRNGNISFEWQVIDLVRQIIKENIFYAPTTVDSFSYFNVKSSKILIFSILVTYKD